MRRAIVATTMFRLALAPPARATRARLPGTQPYFWTAISARTGATAFKVYAGNGLGFNNNYAGLSAWTQRHGVPRRDRRDRRAARRLISGR